MRSSDIIIHQTFSDNAYNKYTYQGRISVDRCARFIAEMSHIEGTTTACLHLKKMLSAYQTNKFARRLKSKLDTYAEYKNKIIITCSSETRSINIQLPSDNPDEAWKFLTRTVLQPTPNGLDLEAYNKMAIELSKMMTVESPPPSPPFARLIATTSPIFANEALINYVDTDFVGSKSDLTIFNL